VRAERSGDVWYGGGIAPCIHNSTRYRYGEAAPPHEITPVTLWRGIWMGPIGGLDGSYRRSRWVL
jgi:hypothetical protein